MELEADVAPAAPKKKQAQTMSLNNFLNDTCKTYVSSCRPVEGIPRMLARFGRHICLDYVAN